MDASRAATDYSEEEWEALTAAVVADGPMDVPGENHCYGSTDLAFSPGPGLVAALAFIDPTRLTALERLAYVQATERAMSWLHARQAEALVTVAGPRPRVDEYPTDGGVITIEDAARSEVAVTARWSESMAHDRITSARLLHGPFARTRAALAAGEITARHAEVITAAGRRLSGYADWIGGPRSTDARRAAFDSACADLEATVLPTACTADISATRRRAERAVQRLDAAGVESRRREAQRRRDVWVEPEPDGMALLISRMGMAEARACLAAVDTHARSPEQSADPTSPAPLIGERRVLALTSRLLSDGALAGTPVVRTHVDLVIDLPTLLGLADEPATIDATGPGGPQPLAADAARALIAADDTATLRRLVSDPLTGHLLDRGRRAYAVPRALREFLIARDRTCRFPGCHRRAENGDADHALEWCHGGETSRANLGMLCRRHHHLKTFGGWAIVGSEVDGSCRWRSPHGDDHDRPPPGLLSDG